MGSSPAGSLPRAARARFRDLDDFLNSDESEEEEETDSEDESLRAVPVTAPPRRDIVPEYDEGDTEDESEDEKDSDDDDDDDDDDDEYDEYNIQKSEKARLYHQ
jgi:hypothetical protein